MATEVTAQPARTGESDLQVLHGREFNKRIAGYTLPADSEEQSRLDVQHEYLKIGLGALYPAPNLVRSALRIDQRRRPIVMDVGTGSGVWAVEMAKEFPNADIKAIDIIVPRVLADAGRLPANFQFDQADANAELDKYERALEVVHARAVWGIPDPHLWLYQAARSLRPKGVLLLSITMQDLLDEGGNLYPNRDPGEPGFRWVPYFLKAIGDAGAKRHVNPAMDWKSWLDGNPNYEGVVQDDLMIPLGTPKEGMSDTAKRMAELHSESVSSLTAAFRPLIVRSGVLNEEEADRMCEGVKNDLKDPSFNAFMEWRYVTAVRKDAEWVPREGAPPPITSYSYGWSRKTTS